MEASKPKWVNPVLNIIGVNSPRLGGLQFFLIKLQDHNIWCCVFPRQRDDRKIPLHTESTKRLSMIIGMSHIFIIKVNFVFGFIRPVIIISQIYFYSLSLSLDYYIFSTMFSTNLHECFFSFPLIIIYETKTLIANHQLNFSKLHS